MHASNQWRRRRPLASATLAWKADSCSLVSLFGLARKAIHSPSSHKTAAKDFFGWAAHRRAAIDRAPAGPGVRLDTATGLSIAEVALRTDNNFGGCPDSAPTCARAARHAATHLFTSLSRTDNVTPRQAASSVCRPFVERRQQHPSPTAAADAHIAAAAAQRPHWRRIPRHVCQKLAQLVLVGAGHVEAQQQRSSSPGCTTEREEGGSSGPTVGPCGSISA